MSYFSLKTTSFINPTSTIIHKIPAETLKKPQLSSSTPISTF